ncbi:hypothetical protein ACFP1Z_05515 [Streptomyces gamaensis]|uniref:Nucleotidyl transferase AbiEii/AbiGii toxin family protein n=1 Tax=Streptomyces gamaensis TaxID=1763542 RepID=A0ABW0YSZ7_9ACTN
MPSDVTFPGPPPYERLLPDLLAAGRPYSLVLGGSWALYAHGLTGRTGPGVELVTESPVPMADIAAALRAGLAARGWQAEAAAVDPLSLRLLVAEPGGAEGERLTADLRKETLWRPPSDSPYGPVLAAEDAVGLRVRALADLGLPRDLVDVRAASARWSPVELEELARRHAPETFDLTDLQARLAGTEWLDDWEFARCGLDAEETAALRRWAQGWADDIAERVMEEAPYEDAPEPGAGPDER